VAKARADNHPVLVDFTAQWCVTCQLNIKPVLGSEAVSRKLKEIDAVTLVADYTRRPDVMTDELYRFGRAGVPLVLVYPKDPKVPPIVLPEALTSGIVLDALDQAAR
jgi:thiol:disulfide interchange protein DsbD